MKLIKSDPERRIDIPGVAGPVQRPVDIDRLQTDFKTLRSLRIYRFEAGAIIDGHAEEDEVFVVVLAGSVEFAATGAPPMEEASTHLLSAPGGSEVAVCAAYLPPLGAYRLRSTTDSVIAYARATPESGNPPASFQAAELIDGSPVQSLLEESTYARRLRLRLFHLNASQAELDFTPISEPDAHCEALIHLQFLGVGDAFVASAAGAGLPLIASWDTVASYAGELPKLHVSKGSCALALVVFAV